MTNIKKIIGENITELRKQNNYTQQDLANLLVYSDKSISKWERGESTPDIEVLIKITELFKVDINYLLTPISDEEKQKRKKIENKRNSYKIFVSLLSCMFIWFTAIFLFVAFKIIEHRNDWIIFIWAIPASSVILIIFNAIWGKMKWFFPISSFMLWSTLASFYLHVLIYTSYNIWQVYLLGIPLQMALILWYLLIKSRNELSN